jgi:hypothetical protein
MGLQLGHCFLFVRRGVENVSSSALARSP